jgi:uncharacterized damage-inducible protein DinB
MREQLVPAPLPGYPPEIGASLWRLEDTRRRTLRLLADLPGEFIDLEWRGNSIGTILYHVALIEADWLYSEILEEPIPEELMNLFPADDRDQQGVLTLVQGEALEDHLTRLSTVRTIFLEKLRGMTAEEFNRPRSLPNYDVSPAWVLHHLSQHEAEHRGELGAAIAALRTGSSGEIA